MIESTTTYSKKDMIALNRFQLLVKSRALLIGFSAFFLAAGILLIFLADDGIGRLMGMGISVLFGLGFIPLCMLVNHFRAMMPIRTSKTGSPESEGEFRLDEEMFSARVTKPDLVSIIDAKWKLIDRGYETKEYFILDISNLQAFLISKNGITRGSAGEMTELLRKALGKRFVSYVSVKKPKKTPKEPTEE